MPTKEQFLEFFDIAGSKKGTRKDKLAENLGAELAFDQTMDVLMNNEVAKQRFEGIQALTNNDLKDTAVIGSSDRTQEYQNLNYIPVQDLLKQS